MVTKIMTVKLVSHLPELLKERKMSMREFSRLIDYRLDTVRQLYHGTSVRLPVELLERTCLELNCELSDVITVKREVEEREKETRTNSKS